MADKEYIERGALIEMLNNKAKTDYEMGLYNHGALTESFIRFVERQPAADVVEVRHGEWIFKEYGEDTYTNLTRIYECSLCGRTIECLNEADEPYCHCGAKMDGERKEQT